MSERAPIVAELGRPETPAETAARKAESSRRHRANQTMRNLVASLAASLLVVAFLIFVIVRPDNTSLPAVDYATVASQTDIPGGTALAPTLPSGWSANAAEVRLSGGVTVWYIGFVTPGKEFIALEQGFAANDTWLAQHLPASSVPAPVTAGGISWQAYAAPAPEKAGNHKTVWTYQSGADDYVLYGTANTAEFTTLATAIAVELTK